MIGNGLTPIDMLGISREEVHTTPDQTKNYLNHIALNASHWLNNNVMLSGNMYHRTSNRKTLNGDLNDDYNPDALAGNDCDPGAGLTEENCSPGIMNRSRIKQRNMGFNFQSAFNQDIWGKEHNPINERHRPGYARGGNNPMKVCATKVIRHTGNVVEQVKVNCYGQVISSKIIRR